jgi:hypothetical protein
MDGDRQTDIFAMALALNGGDIACTVADLFSCAGIALGLLAKNNPATREADHQLCYQKLSDLCRSAYDDTRAMPSKFHDVH